MKKLLALLLAALMVTCLTVTAFAVDEDVENANVPSAQIGEGKTVAAADQNTVVSENENTAAKESVKEQVESINKAGKKTGSVSLLVNVKTGSGNTTAKLTYKMPEGQELSYVLVYDGQANTWTEIPAKDVSYDAKTGALTITSTAFTAAQGATISVVTKTAASGSQGSNSTEPTSPLSPQDGEVTTSVYVACAALMAVAAAAFFIKSRKAA